MCGGDGGQIIETPEPINTPEYYRKNYYQIWFKFSNISNCFSNLDAANLLHKYSYLCVNDFLLEEHLPFQFFIINKYIVCQSLLSNKEPFGF